MGRDHGSKSQTEDQEADIERHRMPSKQNYVDVHFVLLGVVSALRLAIWRPQLADKSPSGTRPLA